MSGSPVAVLLSVLLAGFLRASSAAQEVIAMEQQLQRVAFRNSGTTHKADRYSWQLIEPTGGQTFYYLEPQNVSTVHDVWSKWQGSSGNPNSGRRYKFLLPAGPPPAPPPPASCKVLSTTDAHDIPGHDAGCVQKLPSGQAVRAVSDCEVACCATAGCDGFVFTPSTPRTMGACTDLTAPCCFLKKQAVGAPQIPCAPFGNKTLGKACIASTMMNPTAPTTGYHGTAPPSGIRSAVPLGGISCGTVELRGDGSFSEWTIMNQSPAGAAKIAEYEDAFAAVRLCGSGGCAARILQTHPHGSAATSGVAGVDSLTYSGTHPVSRLQPTDDGLVVAAPGLNTSLFAFSSLVAANMTASARPAVAFSLTLDNKGGSTSANASFLLNMPLQVENDQSRPGTPLGAATVTANSSVCASHCEAAATCLSWNFVRSTGMCQLQSNGPLNRYTLGTDSGVKGHWRADADGRCVTLTRPGKMPFSGEVSLCASTPDGGDSTVVQLRPHTDVSCLLRDFARGASLASTDPGAGASKAAAQHGAIQVSAVVAPGASTAITITFGWRFPHLDWFSYDCGLDPESGSLTHSGCYSAIADKPNQGWEYGNHYAEVYPTARAAAWNGADAAELAQTLKDIDAVHSIFMTSSALPAWLQDHLVNSVSHARDSYWFTGCPTCTGQGCGQGCIASNDARVNKVFWRMFEANDCPDLDSIHNDGERHMPYITLWPDAERSKMAAWAHNQVASGNDTGMLPEQINQYDPDQPEGRRMGDGSSAFVLEVLELYRGANDTTTLHLYWPTVKRILTWQIRMSAAFGVPQGLQTTYDILGFPAYEISAYVSVFHMATMAAGAQLATAMGDTAFAQNCTIAKETAKAAFDVLQWNATKNSYDAGSKGCTKGQGCTTGVGVFADSFYAQVLAYSAGLGLLIEQPERLEAQLATQLKRGCIHFAIGNETAEPGCPNGMVVLTGRAEDGDKTGGCDLQVWEMAPPNHASLGIHIGQSVDDMLAVFEPSATSWSKRLNNQWDTAGIKDTSGYGTVSSHYGMHMVAWHIPIAISGQQAELHKGSLTFDPKVKAPYTLPVFMPGVLGTLTASSSGTHTLTLTVGELDLDVLAVAGKAAPGKVHVAVGKPITW